MPRQARGEVVDPTEVQILHACSGAFDAPFSAGRIRSLVKTMSIGDSGFASDWSFSPVCSLSTA